MTGIELSRHMDTLPSLRPGVRDLIIVRRGLGVMVSVKLAANGLDKKLKCSQKRAAQLGMYEEGR